VLTWVAALLAWSPAAPRWLHPLVAVGFWALLLIVLPQIYMIDFSFHPKLLPREVGGPKDVYTLENYRYFLYGSTTSTQNWNTTHLTAFWTTIVASIAVTFLNFCLCYPLAFYMAQSARPAQLRLVLLIERACFCHFCRRYHAGKVIIQGDFFLQLVGKKLDSSRI
jgi:ABC-type spermidine/putrescine transport system permease subunit I